MADAWNDSDDDEKKKPTSTKVRWKGRSSARTRATTTTKAKRTTTPAWQDDDDEDIRVDLRSASRLKKLRQAPTDRVLKGAALEERYERGSKQRKARRIGPRPQSRML